MALAKSSRVQGDPEGVSPHQSSTKASTAFADYVAEYNAASKDTIDALHDGFLTEHSNYSTKSSPRKRLSLIRRRPRSVRPHDDEQSYSTMHTFKTSNTRSRLETSSQARRQSKPMKLIADAVKVTRRNISPSSTAANVIRSRDGNTRAEESYAITLPDGLIRDVRGSVLATLLDFSLTELRRHMHTFDSDDDEGEVHETPKQLQRKCDGTQEGESADNEVRPDEPQLDSSKNDTENENENEFALVVKKKVVPTDDLSGSHGSAKLTMSNLFIKGVQMVEIKTEDGKTKLVPKHEKNKIVSYRSLQGIVEALIIDVHMDDMLEPYYTIRLADGREKQTDNNHILLLPDIEKPKANSTKQDRVHSVRSNGTPQLGTVVKKDPPGSVAKHSSSNHVKAEEPKRSNRRYQTRKSITQFVQTVVDASMGRSSGEENPKSSSRGHRHHRSQHKSHDKRHHAPSSSKSRLPEKPSSFPQEAERSLAMVQAKKTKDDNKQVKVADESAPVERTDDKKPRRNMRKSIVKVLKYRF